jgi:cation transport ATPase
VNQRVVLIYMGLLVLAFLLGKRFGPERLVERVEWKTKEVRVQDEQKQTSQVTRIVETVRKDGRPVKTTITKTESASERKTATRRDTEHRELKEVENRRGVTVSALVGLPMASITTRPVYGVSAQKPFMGPITVGVWAFTDLRVGISLGLEF